MKKASRETRGLLALDGALYPFVLLGLTIQVESEGETWHDNGLIGCQLIPLFG